MNVFSEANRKSSIQFNRGVACSTEEFKEGKCSSGHKAWNVHGKVDINTGLQDPKLGFLA